jgi:hypothetical protein
MRVDEMVMSAPFSLCSSTTGKEVIFECDGTDHFIGREGALESYSPSSLPIEISPEVDEKTKV